MDIVVERLCEHPGSVDRIAKWHHDEWQHISPGRSLGEYTQSLASYYRSVGIPQMFVAMVHGSVVGTAALVDHDMETHEELSPWLASVYVEKEHRRKGVGKALVDRVIEEACSLRVGRLYLFTASHERYYTRFGWSLLFQESYHGEQEYVMCLDIPL